MRLPLFSILGILTLHTICIERVQAQVVPESRRPVWQGRVGVPGGIPHRTTVYRTFSPGATSAQIQSAIDSCPPGQVIQLTEGTFNLGSQIRIYNRSEWTLRGAGQGKTILSFGSAASGFSLGQFPWITEWPATTPISAGFDEGSTNITLGSVSGLGVGKPLFLEQDNDSEVFGYGAGGSGSATYNSSGRLRDGNRVLSQIVSITAISGSSVTFWPPLNFSFNAARNPRAVGFGNLTGPRFAGIEDLTISGSTSGMGVWWLGAYGCWLKNVELTRWGTFGFEIQYSLNMEIRDCYIHEPFAYDWGKGYSIQFDQANNCLVENNMLWKFQDGIILQGGCSGNVIAYNCAFQSYPAYNGIETMLSSFFGNHTPYPLRNLFEGNYGNGFHSDFYYGPSREFTLLRNFFSGTDPDVRQNRIVVNLDAKQKNYSVVGNILGSSGTSAPIYAKRPDRTISYANTSPLNWVYDAGSSSFPYTQNVIFRLGFPYIGNNGTGSGLAAYDANVRSTTIIHGNYDFSSKSIKWDSTIADRTIPNSYYLASKPAWFGNLKWPPYDPADGPSVSAMSMTNLPAGYRFIYGTYPGSGPINEPPRALATSSASSGVAPLTVNFSSAGSSDPEGAALVYNWAFGDGTASAASNPVKVYSADGIYNATLTVSDGTNSVTTPQIRIEVGNKLPVVVASANPRSGEPPLLVSFSSAGSSDPEGASLAYSWDFGDGQTSTVPNPTHTYAEGRYVARLTVSDGQKSATSSDISIEVLQRNLSGLVLAFSFDEGAGTVANDRSGLDNDGSIQGATFAATGKYGRGLSFNGTSDLVVVNASDSLNLGSAMTLEAWVYPTSTRDTWSAVIHKETDAYFLHASSVAGSMQPAGGAIVNGVERFSSSPSAIPLNTWTHLAVTYDGSAMKTFINGTEVASQAAQGTVESNLKALRIGGNVPYGQFFAGLIDEVRVYNRALNASEIISDMSSPIGQPSAPQGVRITP